jgi:predicted esterase
MRFGRLVAVAAIAPGLILGVRTTAATDSAVGAFVQTTALTLKDDVAVPVDPARRRFTFKSSTKKDPPPQRVVIPVAGGPNDPRAAGASVVVQNGAGSGETVRVDLPASGWMLLGSPTNPTGYGYRSADPNGAISKVTVKQDQIRIKGGKAAWGYTLDEAQQQRIAVRVQLGGMSWCADAPAKTSGTPPSTAKNDQPGRFVAAPKTPAPSACPVAAPAFQLTVTNGYGSGSYPSGTRVHVWANARPQDQLVTGWTGDAALLVEPAEWHTTLLMPARDTTIAATVADRPTTLAVSSYTGSTARPKTVRSLIPPNPRGLVLFLHGTGGSNNFITSTETFPVVLRALESGYGVLGTEAEEAVAGDLNGDGKERWDAALTATNIDFANLDALLGALRTAGTIAPTTPLYALGMSNGGATAISLGAVGASAVAPLYPALRFAAAISFCASGRAGAIAVTTTPTAFLLCANDDNETVDNAEAIANSATLAGRGIPTLVDLHQASPLYDERFARESTISLSASQALATELRAASMVAANGFLVAGSDAIVAAVTANPTLLPTLVALPPAARADVVDQLRAMGAEHQMFSDWAARAVGWFDAHP